MILNNKKMTNFKQCIKIESYKITNTVQWLKLENIEIKQMLNLNK